MGGKSLADVLSRRLPISTREAHRRIGEAADLGPRTALTGQPLDAKLPNVAAAQANGEIGPEHVAILRRFFDQLPGHVNYQAREQAEAQLARIAGGLRPDELRRAAERLAYLLNQDGELPADADRARKRHLTLGKQHADGMSELRGLVDPECRATLEAVWANRHHRACATATTHTVRGRPTQQGADSQRSALPSPTQPRRTQSHGTKRAVLRRAGQTPRITGHHRGEHHLQELESSEGFAVTGAGSLLPMSDVIRLASHSHHYLYIYDKHTNEPPGGWRTRKRKDATTEWVRRHTSIAASPG